MPETRDLTLRLRQEALPPHDASHGTPHTVVRRTLDIELPEGRSRWEQTDYGHPGRFNPWEPREVAPKLQPKTEHLRVVAGALSTLLDG